MKTLNQTDAWTASFAQGFCELGDYQNAIAEIEKLSPEARTTPTALSVRWQAYAGAEHWEAAWVVSKVLCDVLPDSPEAWICQANTLRKFKGVRNAYDLIKAVISRFDTHPVIQYNLGCYASQLGNFEEAARALTKAFRLENGIALRIASVYDPDLRPLWEKIGNTEIL